MKEINKQLLDSAAQALILASSVVIAYSGFRLAQKVFGPIEIKNK